MKRISKELLGNFGFNLQLAKFCDTICGLTRPNSAELTFYGPVYTSPASSDKSGLLGAIHLKSDR
jgi:hypothetical protein